MENNKYDCLCLSLTPVDNFSTLSLLVKLCFFICILKKTDEQIKKIPQIPKKILCYWNEKEEWIPASC